jgi:hypothetical protein
MKVLTCVIAVVAIFSSKSAFASDAIVAAASEAVEYLRICDAYGSGYFYIPGTATCLRIGGFLRYDVSFGVGGAFDNNQNEDWGVRTRAKVWFDANSDTEWGTLWSRVALEGNYRPSNIKFRGVSGGKSTDIGDPLIGGKLDQGFIEISGFRVGKFYTWWNDDFTGEVEAMTNIKNTNSVRYQYTGGDFYAGIAMEELGGTTSSFGGPFTIGRDEYSDSFGVDATAGGKIGEFSWSVYGGYDAGNDEGAVTARIGREIGPGKAELATVWSSGLGKGANGGNAYYNLGHWAVVAQYAVKVTDKFTMTPTVQYNQDITTDHEGNWDDGYLWRGGVTLDYQVVKDLAAKFAAAYVVEDYGRHELNGDGRKQWVEGLFRLERDF